MSELPKVFDGPTFVPLAEEVILTLSNDAAATYVVLANAAALLAGADEAVAAAQDDVTECVADVSNAEKYRNDYYPEPKTAGERDAVRVAEHKRMIAFNAAERARQRGQ
jgi:hypothetical protein